MKLTVGISPCPNDTFAFYGAIHRKVDLHGLELELEFLDVQCLNRRLLDNHFDVTKASFVGALRSASSYYLLPSGAAIGYGTGPILVGHSSKPPEPHSTVLCPGDLTTAFLLFRILYPEVDSVHHSVFSEIPQRVATGEAEFGVLIHEGRFTYKEQGLTLVTDLGREWEQRTLLPVPLGGIFARRDIGEDACRRFAHLLRDSIDYASQHREEVLPFMQHYAQELDDQVIWDHVNLYVTPATIEMGVRERQAIRTLREWAVKGGIVEGGSRELEIVE